LSSWAVSGGTALLPVMSAEYHLLVSASNYKLVGASK
jgi:hypothetical protein